MADVTTETPGGNNPGVLSELERKAAEKKARAEKKAAEQAAEAQRRAEEKAALQAEAEEKKRLAAIAKQEAEEKAAAEAQRLADEEAAKQTEAEELARIEQLAREKAAQEKPKPHKVNDAEEALAHFKSEGYQLPDGVRTVHVASDGNVFFPSDMSLAMVHARTKNIRIFTIAP